MSSLQTFEEKSVISKKLSTLLEELDEECTHVKGLIARLKIDNLSTEQVEDVLAELNAAVVHLNTHTEGLDVTI